MTKKNQKWTNEELVRMIKEGDESKKEELWKQCERLCVKLSQKYMGLCHIAGIEVEDLMQELYFGFLKALEQYDVDSGKKFTSYLTFHIWNACQAALGIQHRKDLRKYPISLETTNLRYNNNGDFYTLEETIPADYGSIEDADDDIYNDDLKTVIAKATENLSETDKIILYYRFEMGYALREIVPLVNMSHQGVSNRLKCTLTKLRRNRDLLKYLERDKKKDED